MPVGSLLQVILERAEAVADRAAGAPLVQPGYLEVLRGDGLLWVRVNGRLAQARSATEEPLGAGAHVWVSETKDGDFVVHGSRSL